MVGLLCVLDRATAVASSMSLIRSSLVVPTALVHPALTPMRRTSRTPLGRHPLRAVLAIALTSLALAAGSASGVDAQDPEPTPGPAPAPDPADTDAPWLEDERLTERVRGVEVDSVEHRGALDAYRATEERIAAAEEQILLANEELVTLAESETRVERDRVLAQRRNDKSEERLAVLRPALEELAISEYMRGGTDGPADLGLGLEADAAQQGRHLIARTAVAEQLRSVRSHAAVADETAATIAQREAELSELRERIADAAERRDTAALDRDAAIGQLVLDGERVADARLTADVVGLEMSLVALDAYVKAADALAQEDPACGLHWSLLAAIGHTESRHGTYGGAAVEPDGSLTQPIIGIALDGDSNTAVVSDSDGGALDGDPVHDRAVGPMQFIPSTWQRWQRDSTDDGEADPQNYYDATLTAAVYLCEFGPLHDHGGARRAALGYNFSGAYADLVLERAGTYASFDLPLPSR